MRPPDDPPNGVSNTTCQTRSDPPTWAYQVFKLGLGLLGRFAVRWEYNTIIG